MSQSPRALPVLVSLLVLGGVALVSDEEARAQDLAADAGGCPGEAGPACPAYERYENAKFAFSVDVPTFLTRKGADADGRGQPFAYGTKARARAWAMYNVPQMSLAQLFGDWTRRAGITFQALAMNTWVVRGKDDGRYYYSRSILADGIIVSIEITYDPSLADAFEPILARMGPSLQVLPGQGPRTASTRSADADHSGGGSEAAPSHAQP